jgi:hypothetical protein
MLLNDMMKAVIPHCLGEFVNIEDKLSCYPNAADIALPGVLRPILQWTMDGTMPAVDSPDLNSIQKHRDHLNGYVTEHGTVPAAVAEIISLYSGDHSHVITAQMLNYAYSLVYKIFSEQDFKKPITSDFLTDISTLYSTICHIRAIIAVYHQCRQRGSIDTGTDRPELKEVYLTEYKRQTARIRSELQTIFTGCAAASASLDLPSEDTDDNLISVPLHWLGLTPDKDETHNVTFKNMSLDTSNINGITYQTVHIDPDTLSPELLQRLKNIVSDSGGVLQDKLGELKQILLEAGQPQELVSGIASEVELFTSAFPQIVQCYMSLTCKLAAHVEFINDAVCKDVQKLIDKALSDTPEFDWELYSDSYFSLSAMLRSIKEATQSKDRESDKDYRAGLKQAAAILHTSLMLLDCSRNISMDTVFPPEVKHQCHDMTQILIICAGLGLTRQSETPSGCLIELSYDDRIKVGNMFADEYRQFSIPDRISKVLLYEQF